MSLGEEGQQHGERCRWIAEVRCEGKVRKWKQILPDMWLSRAERRQVTGGGFGVKGEFKMVFSVWLNSAPISCMGIRACLRALPGEDDVRDSPHGLPQKQWRTPGLSGRWEEGGDEGQKPQEGNY